MDRDNIMKLIELVDETMNKIFKENNEEAKKFYYHIIEGISEVLLLEEICPLCGEELKTIKSQEYMGDCQCAPAYEDVERYVCKNGHKFE